MPENTSLFDTTPALPTSRAVALSVRNGDTAALADALRRADNARYQEVSCRSALNPVEGMPFRWTLNPYRGCTHGCHYCFARRFHTQFDLGPGDDFSSVILVKVNFAEVLRRELARPSWKKGLVAFGTATDPYQPIEGHYKITRRSLEALAARPTPVGLVTKGPMAVRDSDILADLSRRTQCTVYFSVPTVDEDAWRLLEPGTAHPLQRLRAVRTLNDAGVNAGVLMAPIVPGITSHPAKLQRTVRAIADHGACFMGASVMHLEGGTRTHFLEFLSREFPHLSAKYGSLYAGKHARKSYAAQVRAILDTLKQRYSVRQPPTRAVQDVNSEDHPAEERQLEQGRFPWHPWHQ